MLDAHGGPPTARNVFIIEDDQDDAFLLKRALEAVYARAEAKPRITHLENGLDAIYMVGREDLRSNLPDIIIVDLNMPVMNGVRFLRSLRDGLNIDIPVIVLTTSDQEAVHAEAREAGADDVFVKPDTQDKLVAIVRTIVDRYAPLVNEGKAGA